jgi:predicted transcriptional regulator
LVQILTHHLTQLYQNHRVQRTKNVIEIADEDVLTALKIIEALHLNTIENKTHLSKINRNYYLKIVENYNDSLFKSSELQSCLNLSKSQINELLNLFLEHHLIERYGHKNKGFYYKIIQIRTQQIPEKTKQYNDIFDDFTDFNDNENIEYQYRKDNFRF